jgi:hypothetical protein
MERLGESGAGFRSLTEANRQDDTGRPNDDADGWGIRGVRAGHAQRRTKAEFDAAREESRIGGRRPKLSPQQQVEIRKMVSKGDKTAADAARLFKIHPATVSGLFARMPQPSSRKVKHAK